MFSIYYAFSMRVLTQNIAERKLAIMKIYHSHINIIIMLIPLWNSLINDTTDTELVLSSMVVCRSIQSTKIYNRCIKFTFFLSLSRSLHHTIPVKMNNNDSVIRNTCKMEYLKSPFARRITPKHLPSNTYRISSMKRSCVKSTR